MSKKIRSSEKLLFENIQKLIETSQKRVMTTVNGEITLLYWNIGNHIRNHLIKDGRAGYGKEILQTLSAKLMELYGKGFGKRNLASMVKFYDYFSDQNILPTLLTKLTWNHFIQLLSVKDRTQANTKISSCPPRLRGSNTFNFELLTDRLFLYLHITTQKTCPRIHPSPWNNCRNITGHLRDIDRTITGH